MLYLGSDHRGFELKESLKQHLTKEGISFEDLGDDHFDKQDDYVDYAQKVAKEVVTDENHRGVLLCGSGVGVDIVANKIDGARCSLVYDKERAIQSRQHEDANILALPADVLSEEEAFEIVKAFLDTEFSHEERHQRRIDKIEQIEKEN